MDLWCRKCSLCSLLFPGLSSFIHTNSMFLQCFISIPAWIYLIMTPRFARTRRFAAPWAMLGVDLFCTILWLSAFATQAAYNTADLCGDRCKLSKAIVGLGVLNTYVFPFTVKSS